MNIQIDKNNWQSFFKTFVEKNHLRPARLEVMDDLGPQEEVNLLPFSGIDLDLKGGDSPVVNLSFGDENESGRHLFHNVNNVNQIYLKADEYGNDEVLEIISNKDTKTLLVFEQLPEIGGD